MYKNKKNMFKKNITHYFKSPFFIAFIILSILTIFLKCFSINNEVFLILGLILSLFGLFLKEKELKIERYFEDDDFLYTEANKNSQYNREIRLATFIIILNILGLLILSIMYYVFNDSLFTSPLIISCSIFFIIEISNFINNKISSYFCYYDFTFKSVLYSKDEYEQNLWIYLRYKEEVLNKISNHEPVYKISYINKQNNEFIKFEDYEIVKREVSKFSDEQLEKVLFLNKAPTFNYNIVPRKEFCKFIISIVSAILVMLNNLFNFLNLSSIKERIDSNVNNVVENILELYSNMNDFLGKMVVFLPVVLLCLLLLNAILKQIYLFISKPRKKAVKKYLKIILEEEEENRKIAKLFNSYSTIQ